MLDQFKDLKGFYVYLLWGDDGPIYVGQSIRIHTRLCQHMSDPEKRQRTRHVEVIKCADHQQMCDTEKRLIIEHRPPLNTTFAKVRTMRVKTEPFPVSREPIYLDDDTVMVPTSLYAAMHRARRVLRVLVG